VKRFANAQSVPINVNFDSIGKEPLHRKRTADFADFADQKPRSRPAFLIRLIREIRGHSFFHERRCVGNVSKRCRLVSGRTG
jgi:hypothetical protein